jgi:uncharacterized delta-60 repeat protein
LKGETTAVQISNRMKTLMVLLLFVFNQTTSRGASLLDSTFNPGSGANGIVEQVLPLADGKILICGNFTTFNGINRAYIARLNGDGSVDPSFTGQASYWVRHMSVQADGKIIIGGFFRGVGSASRNLIARLNSDGSLDPTFDPGLGCTDTLGVGIDGNADPFVFWTEIQADGKILATGNFRNYNGSSSIGIVRINPNGSRDATFNVGSGIDSWGRHIELLPNGQILLSGWFNSYNGRAFNRIARINSDGSPDQTFNPYFGDRTAIYATASLANSKIIATGHSANYEGLFNREMARLNPDGSQDSTFVGYSNEKTESVVVQPDGKIIIGGYFNSVNGQVRTSVARLLADGSLDSSWGANIDNFVWTVALDRDGKLLISGGFYTVDGVSRRGVARLLTGSSFTPPPPAPTLAASATSSSEITLSWSDSATDRTGYSVERKTGPAGTYSSIANLPATARGFVNAGLTAGTQYFYRLRATTSGGTTVYSNESSATTESPTGGTATATFIAADSATRGSWAGKYGANGYNIVSDGAALPSYVRLTPQNKSDWIWEYATSDTRALQKVTSSTDRIAACWYSSAGFSIDLAFTDSSKHRVSFYCLDWDSAGRNQTVQILDGDTGAILDTRTAAGFNGGVYLTWDFAGHIVVKFASSVVNAVVSGIFFDNTVTAPFETAPAAPSNLAGKATYATRIEISWADNAANETALKIYRCIGTSNPYSLIATVPANTTSFTNSNLNSGSLYSYKVVASNNVGDSPASNVATIATPVLPAPPTDLSGVALSGTQIRLSWSDASTNETAFRILRKTGISGSYVTLAFVDANTTTFTNQNLNPGVQYFYKVAAQNDAGVSAASNEISITTPSS